MPRLHDNPLVRCLFSWTLLALALVWLLLASRSYLLQVLYRAGEPFSVLLIAVFVTGLYRMTERFLFLLSLGRPTPAGADRKTRLDSVRHEFHQILEHAVLAGGGGTIHQDQIDLAWNAAQDRAFAGVRLDRGKSQLDLLAAIAPMIGFLGTLVGLQKSFSTLRPNSDPLSVLKGLNVSMTTSLIGVAISLCFMIASWLLESRCLQIKNSSVVEVVPDPREPRGAGPPNRAS